MYRENLVYSNFIDKVKELSDSNAIKLNSEQNKLQQKKLIKINKKINKINKKY